MKGKVHVKSALKLEYLQNVKKIDKFGTIFEICQLYDYPVEKFVYETKDGYYNTVFHINGMKGTKAQANSKEYNREK